MRKLALFLILVASCSPVATGDAATVATSIPGEPITPSTFIRGQSRSQVRIGDLPVEVFAPAEIDAYPVVVLVHGGSWVGGEPEYMVPLADDLAQRGVVVFNVSYHTMSFGGRFPDMVEDVACGVAFARKHASEYTLTSDEVTIIGHSAGAHLAALVAFAPDAFVCPDGERAEPDRFVGLAGPYDTDRIPLLATFFGATLEEDPATWAAGNPLTLVDGAPEVPVLLIHGDADNVVPISFTDELDAALKNAGADVTFDVLPGGTHPDAVDPASVSNLIFRFLVGTK